MQTRVVVVVDPRFGERLVDFENRSLWVIDTPDNRAVWRQLKLKPNSSIFKTDDPEAREANL